tara:strand:- start:677 stop:853 length:177 start_codon:yes stop_codon:yes gene_type:complete
MIFTNLKYQANQNGDNVSIAFTLDGQLHYVSLNSVGNRHYDEIMRQVAAGSITIEDAD